MASIKKYLLVAVLFSGIFAVVYFSRNSGTKNIEVKKILQTDFEKEYPQIPEEVVENYIKISQILHNERLKDKEIDELLGKMYIFYSSEMKKNNPLSKLTIDLKAEIKNYLENKIRILSYRLGKVETVNLDNNIQAVKIDVEYSIASDQIVTKSVYTYILKQENKKWKIWGFDLKKIVEKLEEEAVKKNKK